MGCNLNLLFMILLRIGGKRLGVLWVALTSRGGGEKSPIRGKNVMLAHI